MVSFMVMLCVCALVTLTLVPFQVLSEHVHKWLMQAHVSPDEREVMPSLQTYLKVRRVERNSIN